MSHETISKELRVNKLTSESDNQAQNEDGSVNELTLESNDADEKRKTNQAMEATVYSHDCVEYYTPPQYIEAARKVMGEITLDPASCEFAQKWIKAKRYYTEKDDGLKQNWFGSIWLNPPYSLLKYSVFLVG